MEINTDTMKKTIDIIGKTLKGLNMVKNLQKS